MQFGYHNSVTSIVVVFIFVVCNRNLTLDHEWGRSSPTCTPSVGAELPKYSRKQAGANTTRSGVGNDTVDLGINSEI